MPCCSVYGWCGSTVDYCGANCYLAGSYLGSGCLNSEPISPPEPACEHVQYNLATSHIVYDGNSTDGADFIVSGSYALNGDTVTLKMSKPNTGTSMYSTKLITYGRISADIKTSRTGGVVTSFILQAQDLDEIDFEWVGYNLNSTQTNWFKYGQFPPPPASNADFLPSRDTFADFHTYTVDWSPKRIQWLIDGKVERELNTGNPSIFPSSQSRVGFGIWDGGSGAEGTREWSGGPVNFQSEDMLTQGYFGAKFKNIVFECTSQPW
ncbi:putative glycosidase CRH2 [Entomophthora muscae]|uniref:Glycosidase CRH2 n=1 Tax=Entomophthora muscae TaxID=34485 RepID=A0ACC2SLZ3_9FUNG|nr:putative glycosidase CRH2 [Entomophthora muscae]